MAKRGRNTKRSGNGVNDFRHSQAQRKNNPPAGIASVYEKPQHKVQRYEFDPHLDPQLVWAGKAEHTSFEVEVVSLHIHERISTRAILDAVRRPQPLQLDLFGETPLPADQQIEFYRHEVGWANRLILGDSLLVMNSLLVKEGMAGKVQMIYIDPPYGIKYSSNFQPRIDRRDVKDKDEDLTREPEQIKAYRDTWTLGIHSYLTYLRDRLLLARELLTESGSIFVQISDENLHLVRCLVDEVFGRENFVAVVAFRKKQMSLGARYIDSMCDYILWYGKDKSQIKYRQLYIRRQIEGDAVWAWVELPDGSCRRLSSAEISNHKLLSLWSKIFRLQRLKPAGFNPGCVFDVEFDGKVYKPPYGGSWVTNEEGIRRLLLAQRITPTGNNLNYNQLFDDYPVVILDNLWEDTSGEPEKLYAVQTNTKVVERCILMTTDPGDLVFDPTCGSGTTAWCAEKWGRRWITCDTSRVALAIARQRLMTAKFDYYELREPERGPAGGFNYETVPHITLESIAKNTEIDAIAANYQPQIEQALAELNAALGREWKEWEVPREVPHPVWPEEARQAYWRLYALKNNPFPVGADPLREMGQPQGVAPAGDADVGAGPRACPGQPQGVAPTNVSTAQEETQRLLETVYRLTGHRWELNAIPDPMPPEDWPDAAKDALRRFWKLKCQKRKEIDESIQRNAPQETLYDKPQVKRGVVRVTGPFTVEAIPVPAVEDPAQAPIPPAEGAVGAGPCACPDAGQPPVVADARAYPGQPREMGQPQGDAPTDSGPRACPDAGQPQGVAPTAEPGRISDRGGDYLATMINLLKQQGSILFPRGKRLQLANIQPLNLGYLHAEAEGAQNGERRRVAVSFGPQYGPVTAFQTDEAIRIARRAGYDILILAGFSIEASAQAIVQEVKIPGLDVHFANVAPDVLMQVEETRGKVNLLKTTRASQIFTVFGQPDVAVERRTRDGKWVCLRSKEYQDALCRDAFDREGEWRVELRGVDIYDPLTGNVESKGGKEVAAWFLDTDYDGKTFHICQAFFPGDANAWEKLQRALKAEINAEAFERMRGTVSFPFEPGQHRRIAVKVIDFRGNEVVRVIPLNAEQYR
jgi:adenine-specific DNA-methyltransferase